MVFNFFSHSYDQYKRLILILSFWLELYNYTTFYLTCIVCPSEKIFPDLDENLPLGVIFGVDHESDVIFSIRDRDQGVTGPSKFRLN